MRQGDELSAPSQSRQGLRDELLALMRSWDIKVDGTLTADTPLIDSGLFDSLALFNLVLWVERQTGATLDPTTVDLAAEWNTVSGVLDFIDRRRGRAR
jgi:acyl carrier protein